MLYKAGEESGNEASQEAFRAFLQYWYHTLMYSSLLSLSHPISYYTFKTNKQEKLMMGLFEDTNRCSQLCMVCADDRMEPGLRTGDLTLQSTSTTYSYVSSGH